MPITTDETSNIIFLINNCDKNKDLINYLNHSVDEAINVLSHSTAFSAEELVPFVEKIILTQIMEYFNGRWSTYRHFYRPEIFKELKAIIADWDPQIFDIYGDEGYKLNTGMIALGSALQTMYEEVCPHPQNGLNLVKKPVHENSQIKALREITLQYVMDLYQFSERNTKAKQSADPELFARKKDIGIKLCSILSRPDMDPESKIDEYERVYKANEKTLTKKIEEDTVSNTFCDKVLKILTFGYWKGKKIESSNNKITRQLNEAVKNIVKPSASKPLVKMSLPRGNSIANLPTLAERINPSLDNSQSQTPAVERKQVKENIVPLGRAHTLSSLKKKEAEDERRANLPRFASTADLGLVVNIKGN